jgi:hypothetical protein
MADASGVVVWSHRLWAEAERVAAGQDGAVVVRALATASGAVWQSGLDHAFGQLRADLAERGEHTMSLETASAFDICWLRVFITTLAATPTPAETTDA